jgi:formylmethanofuran dehydrogenase subunit E
MSISNAVTAVCGRKSTQEVYAFAKTTNGCSFAGRYVCDGCQQPCGGVSLLDVGKLSGKLAAARRDRTATLGTNPDNVYDEMKERGAVFIDALTAQAGPTAGQPNLGTEEHEQ